MPKARGPPLWIPTQRLKQKKNCSQVRFYSYGSYSFALASLYLVMPTIFKFEGWNWNSLAQQVCFKPVSSRCLAVFCCNLLYVDFSFNWINSYVLMSCTLQVLLLLYSFPHLYSVYSALSWTNIIWTVSLSWFGNKNYNDIDHKVTMVHRYMFVSCCYPVHFTTELI